MRVLAAGGVIAYPTEAVYGLGCDPWNRAAVLRLLRLKHRSLRKGLIVIAANAETLSRFVYYPSPEARDRVNQTWPGPVTWVLPCCAGVPVWLTGGRHTLAVRVIGLPIAQALCRVTEAIVSTSANPSGCEPARDSLRVRAYFGCSVDLVLPGRVGGQAGVTEIRDGSSGRVLRAGAEFRGTAAASGLQSA